MPKPLSPTITELFKRKFELNCIDILTQAYAAILTKNLTEYHENDITLELVKQMRKNPLSSFFKIDITREFYLDDTINSSSTQSADESDRIDLRFMNWSYSDRFDYFMEAKNLSENDWQKSNGSWVSCNSQITRYIATGIDSFINGKYTKGCLLGYIVNGSVDKVLSKLNSRLLTLNRNSESLYKDPHHLLSYFSSHSSVHVRHIMLEFDSSVPS